MDTSEVQGIFGKLIESDEVITFLSKHPSFKVEKPDSGRQYVISNELGIDLMFEPDDGMQGGKTKHLRKCQCAFLYAQGKDGHTQFNGEIPLGFRFQDTREELINKAKPERTWKIGQGEVPVDFPSPSHDRWLLDGYTISANYNKEGGIMYFILKVINA